MCTISLCQLRKTTRNSVAVVPVRKNLEGKESDWLKYDKSSLYL